MDNVKTCTMIFSSVSCHDYYYCSECGEEDHSSKQYPTGTCANCKCVIIKPEKK